MKILYLSSKSVRLYVVSAVVIIPAYILGQNLLAEQSTVYLAIINQLSVNFIILLYIVGSGIGKYTKGMPKAKGWLIWAAAMVILILFFKYVGGMETIW